MVSFPPCGEVVHGRQVWWRSSKVSGPREMTLLPAVIGGRSPRARTTPEVLWNWPHRGSPRWRLGSQWVRAPRARRRSQGSSTIYLMTMMTRIALRWLLQVQSPSCQAPLATSSSYPHLLCSFFSSTGFLFKGSLGAAISFKSTFF